ncbi:hypothetical protein VZT92_005737 [Zoarces viviparus]|uniref:Uncharacterized protein n=1 Tax=Zoarces viviparus TaxID=48416 RepID=A0AAW1FQI0_ZOAVI
MVDSTPGSDAGDSAAEPGEKLQESSEEPASEEEDPEPPPATNYPQRERHRPKTLTYRALGEPTVGEVGVESLQVSMAPACNRLWRPWIALDIDVTS